MTRFGIGLLALAAIGYSQEPVSAWQKKDNTQRQPAAAQAEMAEDVEVMRRILNKSVGLQNDPTTMATFLMANQTFHGLQHYYANNNLTSNTLPYMSNTALMNYPNTSQPKLADPFDGVYLKGHGVVYTLKVKSGEQYNVGSPARALGLSMFCLQCHADAPVAAARLEPVAPSRAELTEWDRTRNAVRGETTPPPAAPTPTVDADAICKPGKLADALINSLIQNGRHLRHLPAAESLTVVVTLDGVYGSSRAQSATDVARALTEFMGTSGGQVTPANANRQTAPPQATDTLPSGFNEEETKQIALGDLHMKQNNHKDAVAAYLKALERYGLGVVKLPPERLRTYQQRFPAALEETKRSVAELLRKLAYAFLASGDAEKAKKALDASFNVKIEADANPTTPNTNQAANTTPPPAIQVPAKLVLTVKKSDLDLADRLTPAEFKKLVTVETVGLPPADKAKK